MIAWVSHHLPDKDGNMAGGAEMTDDTLLRDAPVEVRVIRPDNWQEALDYDQIVITGTDLLSPYAMNMLARKKPVVAVHHLQTQSPERALLINSSKMFICHTPKHLELELAWTTPKASTWIISPHDVSQFSQKPKESFALWAARNHWQKGPAEAQAWANEMELPFVAMSDKPRAEVLEAMSRAEYFVFLPNAFDAEPRTLIEAVLSGCKIHTNNLAGISSIPNWRDPDTMAELVTNSKDLFWSTVLQ